MTIMNRKELRQIALNYVNKGYSDYETLMYSDDLYDATEEEKEDCGEFLSEIIENGVANFIVDDETVANIETLDAIGVWIVGHDAYPVAIFRYVEHAEEWARDNYFGQWLTKEMKIPADTLFSHLTEEQLEEARKEAAEMVKMFKILPEADE